MCDKGVGPCIFVFILFLIDRRLKKYVVKLFSNPFMLKYCLDRYKIQEMCDKGADDFLST